MIINRELSEEITSCTDPQQLHELITSAQDNRFILKLAAQSPYIDLRCAIFLSAYLNDLVLNPALVSIEHDFPGQVRKIFKVEVDKISTLKIPENLQWWEYLIRHPSSRVRKATASNAMLPDRFKDVTTLDVPSKIGFALNRTISAEHCKILATDPDPQVSTIAKSALRRFDEDKTLIGGNQSLANDNQVFGKGDQINPPKLSFVLKSNQKEQEFHPAALIGSILVILSVGVGLTMLAPGKHEKVVTSKVASPRGGVVSSTPLVQAATEENYAEAVDLANRATLMATSARSKLEWGSIVVLWDNAISKLSMVDKQDADYEKAQSKIFKYQVIRGLHANNGASAEPGK